MAIWFPIVPVGTKRAASCPRSSAANSCKRWTVGSSPKTSSPTSAVDIARRIAEVGWVTVSLRRSIIPISLLQFLLEWHLLAQELLNLFQSGNSATGPIASTGEGTGG